VCWFDLNYHYKAVAQGAYQILYRIRANDEYTYNSLRDVKLKVGPVHSDGFMIEERCAIFDLGTLQAASESFQILTNPDALLTIVGEYEDIQFSFREIDNGRWKLGLELDCVILYRIKGGRVLKTASEIDAVYSRFAQSEAS